jgi:hypothetical protein
MLLTHGVYCLGCCGAMMMNIIWIGGLAIFVLIEKQAARWPHFNKITSAGLVAWGAILLGRAGGFVQPSVKQTLKIQTLKKKTQWLATNGLHLH